MPAAPPLLAAAEVAERYRNATGHAAYRSWCEHCVAGRGKSATHRAQPEGELPEIGADYAYLGPDGSQVTLLVLKDRRTGCLAATQVPAKSAEPYALGFTVGWLRGLGYKRFILR
eukprot:5093365-Amphidinium_carterae.1